MIARKGFLRYNNCMNTNKGNIMQFRQVQVDFDTTAVLNEDNEVMYEGSDAKAEEFFLNLLTDEEKETLQIEWELDIEELGESRANRELSY
jgi:hypothetical protein